MRDTNTAMSTYQANLITEHAGIVTKIRSELNARYNQLQKQHQDFVGHLQNQLQSYEQQIKGQISSLQGGSSSNAPSKSQKATLIVCAYMYFTYFDIVPIFLFINV